MHPGLALLLQAYDYAHEVHCDRWQFAVEFDSLHDAGLTTSDLRWLVCKGYVEHGVEVTSIGENVRTFRPIGGLLFSAKTCVVLTDLEASLLGPVRRGTTPGQRSDTGFDLRNGEGGRLARVPRWDGVARELRLGVWVVKRFQQPAPSQETILAAFEEERWPRGIDDPLPQRPGQDPKRQLHYAILNLNRNQKNRLVRFLGNGKGDGIRWELAAEVKLRRTRCAQVRAGPRSSGGLELSVARRTGLGSLRTVGNLERTASGPPVPPVHPARPRGPRAEVLHG
jgi:hypothetical protein